MTADLKAALDEFNRGVVRARNAYRLDHSATYREAVQRENNRLSQSRRYYEKKAAEK